MGISQRPSGLRPAQGRSFGAGVLDYRDMLVLCVPN